MSTILELRAPLLAGLFSCARHATARYARHIIKETTFILPWLSSTPLFSLESHNDHCIYCSISRPLRELQYVRTPHSADDKSSRSVPLCRIVRSSLVRSSSILVQTEYRRIMPRHPTHGDHFYLDSAPRGRSPCYPEICLAKCARSAVSITPQSSAGSALLPIGRTLRIRSKAPTRDGLRANAIASQ
jgi:hypothetical protein